MVQEELRVLYLYPKAPSRRDYIMWEASMRVSIIWVEIEHRSLPKPVYTLFFRAVYTYSNKAIALNSANSIGQVYSNYHLG